MKSASWQQRTQVLQGLRIPAAGPIRLQVGSNVDTIVKETAHLLNKQGHFQPLRCVSPLQHCLCYQPPITNSIGKLFPVYPAVAVTKQKTQPQPNYHTDIKYDSNPTGTIASKWWDTSALETGQPSGCGTWGPRFCYHLSQWIAPKAVCPLSLCSLSSVSTAAARACGHCCLKRTVQGTAEISSMEKKSPRCSEKKPPTQLSPGRRGWSRATAALYDPAGIMQGYPYFRLLSIMHLCSLTSSSSTK